jgi:ubiquitin carboxyl-terminal hydrolase 10
MLAAFRMLFLREFAAAEMGDSEPNGSGVASDKAIPASAKPEKATSGGIAKSGEAFVPTYVYEAMRENKRFDTMRVSEMSAYAYTALADNEYIPP